MGTHGKKRIPPENTIYRLLVDANIPQAELARMVGVKREYMNRIINRKITPGITLALRICSALGKRAEDVFFESTTPPGA